MRLPRISLCFLVVLCTLLIEINAQDDQVPLTKLGAKTGPTLKFFYCYSCGYKKAYEEYAGILHERYPQLQIDGENYNPPGYNMLIAKCLSLVKILLMIMIVCGINVFQWLGQPQPYFWQWCIENRIYACIMIFFLSNAIEGNLISSGAFEIHFNDVPVWSKLETGRKPQLPELIQIIETHLKMVYPETDFENINFNK
ncbi:thioredoxin reductase-like selenoprotein T homolog CG3887 [Prorops nasuta]|uniref:thioredoxin reductase-like selenoprotein T homolog CG3887 n=1 Tax=Prorops nasuta TaxID=863751 RepID=UPI0034CF789B